MYTSSSEQAQFQELSQQHQEAYEQRLEADTTVSEAKRALSRAQANLEELQAYTRGLPFQQRVQYTGNFTQAQEAITQAQAAYSKATNDFARKEYLASLEAKKAEQRQALETEQARYAQEQEAQAKAEFRSRYLASGGTPEAFEKAFPEMWQAELMRRTQQESHTLRQHMLASGRYNL